VFHQIEILAHRSLNSLATQNMGKFTASGNRWLIFINGRNPRGFATRGDPNLVLLRHWSLGVMP